MIVFEYGSALASVDQVDWLYVAAPGCIADSLDVLQRSTNKVHFFHKQAHFTAETEQNASLTSQL